MLLPRGTPLLGSASLLTLLLPLDLHHSSLAHGGILLDLLGRVRRSRHGVVAVIDLVEGPSGVDGILLGIE